MPGKASWRRSGPPCHKSASRRGRRVFKLLSCSVVPAGWSLRHQEHPSPGHRPCLPVASRPSGFGLAWRRRVGYARGSLEQHGDADVMSAGSRLHLHPNVRTYPSPGGHRHAIPGGGEGGHSPQVRGAAREDTGGVAKGRRPTASPRVVLDRHRHQSSVITPVPWACGSFRFVAALRMILPDSRRGHSRCPRAGPWRPRRHALNGPVLRSANPQCAGPGAPMHTRGVFSSGSPPLLLVHGSRSPTASCVSSGHDGGLTRP